MEKKKNVTLSLSGGMDSGTLLLRCLEEYENVTCISFDYGQKHKIELERASSLVKYLNFERLVESPTKNAYPMIKHQIIKLDGLSQLLNSTLVEGGEEVPEGHYEQENMKDTVIPNRNKIFSSIIQAVSLSTVKEKGEQCDIALGIHAGDHSIYPDCRQEFRDADDVAFRLGNWDSEKVQYFTPYLNGDKFDILKDGERLCKELNLDFDEIYKRTLTSYKPIFIQGNGNSWMVNNLSEDNKIAAIQGTWYSDYKSASSVERIEAFMKLGRPDPVPYADLEIGPVTWEYVTREVNKVLGK